VLAVVHLAWNCSLLKEEEARADIRVVQQKLPAEIRGERLVLVSEIQERKRQLFRWGTQTIVDAQLNQQSDGSNHLAVALAVIEG
jgi:hypothetical protein